MCGVVVSADQRLANYWWRRAKNQEDVVRMFLANRLDRDALEALVMGMRDYVPEPHE